MSRAAKTRLSPYPTRPCRPLVVYKQDSVTGAGISGCLFQLRYLGGETSGVDGTVVGTYVTSANGSFTVTGLKKGYYICEELESDSAMSLTARPNRSISPAWTKTS